MRIFAALLTVLLLLFSISSAQMQDDVIPWPPEAPETLFGPRVQILDVRLESSTLERAHPVTNAWDYRAVVTADGRMYPWPADFPYATGMHGSGPMGLISNQFYLASSSWSSGDFDSLWSLDLSTGVYTRYNHSPRYVDTYCGRLRFSSALVNSWTIIIGSYRQQHVCNLADGRMSLPLPGDYDEWQIHHDERQIDCIVLLSARHIDQADGLTTLFAFNPANLDLQPVGQFMRRETTQVARILNETMQVLTTSSESDPDQSVMTYVVNIAEQRTFQISNEGRFLENPLRVEYRTPLEDGADCEITIIDLLTESQTTYGLNTACHEGYDLGGWRYYRVLKDNGTQADVVRVNALTGESSTLFSGEVEDINWVSSDERYLGLIIDSNGRVDTPPGQLVRVSGSGDAQWVLLDLTTGNQLFETPAMFGGYADTWFPSPYAVGDGWLGLAEITVTELLHIQDGVIVEDKIFQGGIGREIGDGWAVGYPAERINEYGDIASHSLYNFRTGEEIPVITLGTFEAIYWIKRPAEYVGDNQFQVTLTFGGGYQFQGIPPFYDIAIYTIRIEGAHIEEPASD